MKKIILSLTLSVLCIALVACGLSNEGKMKIELYDKYEDLIGALESNDKDAAMQELLEITKNGGAAETEPAVETEDESVTAEKWMKEIVGTWYEKNGMYDDITFRDDATCAYDGKTYSVEFDSKRGSVIDFNLKDGEKVVYIVRLYGDYADNGTSSDLVLWEVTGENTQTSQGSYICAAEYNALRDEWMDKIFGTWYAVYGGIDITFRDDATCTYDSKTYSVEFDFTGVNFIQFLLKDGETTAYEVILFMDYADNGTSPDLHLKERINEYRTTTIGNFICAADHEAKAKAEAEAKAKAEVEAKVTAEKCLKEVVGTWYDMDGIFDITFREDGTCAYNGKTYSVEYNSDRSDSTGIYFNLIYGETATHLVKLERNYAENGTSSDITLWTVVNNGYRSDGYYLCAADYNAQSAEWMDKLVGDWINDSTRITVNSDGTCIIGETTYTVRPRLRSSSNSTVYFYLYNGTTREYELDLAKDFESNGVYADITLRTTSGSSSNFVRASDFEVIELTVNNWLDYFEIVEVLEFRENAFGEADLLYCYRYYCLKDEYVDIIAQYLSTNIAVEYTPVNRGYISCVVDPINRTFTKGERLRNYSETTQTQKMAYSYSSHSEVDYRLRFYFSSGSISKDYFENGTIDYTDDVVMNRIQGTLYILK